MATVLGIDIGGMGIKAAPVDVATGKLLTDRHRILTPRPSTPKAVAQVVSQIGAFFEWKGPTGATFPAVVKHGFTLTAANVDTKWIGTDASKLLSDAIGGPVTVVNDADAAGIAEMKFGAGRGKGGTVIMVTLGTGIGSALFIDGALVPNTELGHLQLRGVDAERHAAESVRESEDLTWKKWSKRLDSYFALLDALFSPDLFIVGGGISKKADKFLPRLSTLTPVVPALLLNDAGIVGAAMAHAKTSPSPARHAD